MEVSRIYCFGIAVAGEIVASKNKRVSQVIARSAPNRPEKRVRGPKSEKAAEVCSRSRNRAAEVRVRFPSAPPANQLLNSGSVRGGDVLNRQV